MKSFPRLMLTVVVVALLGLGLSGVLAYSNSGGKDLARVYLREMRRSEILQQRNAEVIRSLEIKRAIVADLLADRLTLREAAEEFAAAGGMIEKSDTDLVAEYKVPQNEQDLYRQVIAWVRAEEYASPNPEQIQDLTRRLEAELGEDASSPPDPLAEEAAE